MPRKRDGGGLSTSGTSRRSHRPRSASDGASLCLQAPIIPLHWEGGIRKILPMSSTIEGPVYVVKDNIDTDQIIPAQYLNLVPTIAAEYEKLGSYAMIGLPDSIYPTRYVEEGQLDSKYPIIIAGKNYGCGSSREHAPIALGSADCKLVVAESFARIFFRNCVATGELYPCQSPVRL